MDKPEQITNDAGDAGMKDVIYGPEPAIIICADSESGARRAASIVAAAGGRVAANLPIAGAVERLDAQPAPDAVLVDATEDAGEPLDRLLDRLDAAAARNLYPSIVALPESLIDVAAARAPHAAVALLVAAPEAERIAALGFALAARPSLLLEERNDESPRELRRLSEEVGRIARALASMSGEEQGQARATGDRDRRPPAEPPAAPALRALIRARRLRDQYFDPELFADPAWDMLLDLMLARVEGRQVAVSSLCIAAAVPSTTALRWIKRLTDDGLFVRAADPRDGRRVYIDLSESCAETLAAYLKARARLSTAP